MTPLQRKLLSWYGRYGRSTLPWRTVRSPYRTMVSEFMLAQTQVSRVAGKFAAFVERFPDFGVLGSAPTADVVREWKGLGYNTRAVRLQRLARAVTERHGGVLPSEPAALVALPGIGPYTAAAIRAFAFGIDDAPIDTNVRRVVQRVCFGAEWAVAAGEPEIAASARALLPPGRAHDWSSALMDLGAAICTAKRPQCAHCPLRSDCAAAPIDAAEIDAARSGAGRRRRSPQDALPFARTNRYARGRIVDRLRELPPGRRISLLDLHAGSGEGLAQHSLDDVRALVRALERDGLVTCDGTAVALSE